MKTLTALFLILSLSLSAQITGTYKLVKTFDTFYMNWWLPTNDVRVHISQWTPDTLKYTVTEDGNYVWRGKTPITGSNSIYYIQTDFFFFCDWKTRLTKFQDTIVTHTQIYNSDIYYWKKVNEKSLKVENNVLVAGHEINIPFDFELLSITCQLIGSGTAGRVDISHLKPGIYFAKSVENKEIIVKFVKQ